MNIFWKKLKKLFWKNNKINYNLKANYYKVLDSKIIFFSSLNFSGNLWLLLVVCFSSPFHNQIFHEILKPLCIGIKKKVSFVVLTQKITATNSCIHHKRIYHRVWVISTIYALKLQFHCGFSVCEFCFFKFPHFPFFQFVALM